MSDIETLTRAAELIRHDLAFGQEHGGEKFLASVATWLDYAARTLANTCDCHWPSEPFAVARAYIGEKP